MKKHEQGEIKLFAKVHKARPGFYSGITPKPMFFCGQRWVHKEGGTSCHLGIRKVFSSNSF